MDLDVHDRETHTLYAVSESRRSDVPAEVLGEDFAGTVVCDGWTTYPAFSSNFQQCWAHILREAEDTAEKQAEGEPIYHALKNCTSLSRLGWRAT